ncbi:UDP-N-acetylmuramate--L-alanine ligase [Bacillus toyonensis]|uniref:UDP-N-acetylmuramate--L-alanine ligase n=1 Tax=Bacillus toyonensis TaxID=155322 RepID=UPI002E23DEE0|nr:UDP-N-acetylmuramate--L-alanine ligase [Bacillus toyonensis]MED2737397.1 UDP-N-acetylmuramate--L-alanine ligase [Bacillus toyonensis]
MKEKYHFVGIKGSGMSSLAQILFDNGYEVQGSDIESETFTQVGLEQRNISMFPFSKNNISNEHTFIIGNAFDDKNEEVSTIHKNNFKSYRYHEFLGDLMSNFISIGVSGAHGKTSTSSLLAHMLGNHCPISALIGDGTGYGDTNSKYFVFEACEYKRHFLNYSPDYAIITNVDFDHPDYFSGLEDVVSAFDEFASKAKKNVIVCGDDLHSKKLSNFSEMITYGLEEHNLVIATAVNVTPEETSFNVLYKGDDMGRINIPFHGTHAIQNTLAVLTVCLLEGIEIGAIKEHLKTFKGAKRRFNIEEWNETIIVDDYAHHPKEIQVTIEAARQKFPNKELVAVFQPHTFSRTATFLNEFKDSLLLADKVYGCPIFGSAREQQGSLSTKELLDLIPNSDLLTLETIRDLNSHSSSVLLFMGAGDIGNYIDAFKANTQSQG